MQLLILADDQPSQQFICVLSGVICVPTIKQLSEISGSHGTNYEDGSLSPLDAISQKAVIFSEQLVSKIIVYKSVCTSTSSRFSVYEI
jgi:hypothetical protein